MEDTEGTALVSQERNPGSPSDRSENRLHLNGPADRGLFTPAEQCKTTTTDIKVEPQNQLDSTKYDLCSNRSVTIGHNIAYAGTDDNESVSHQVITRNPEDLSRWGNNVNRFMSENQILQSCNEDEIQDERQCEKSSDCGSFDSSHVLTITNGEDSKMSQPFVVESTDDEIQVHSEPSVNDRSILPDDRVVDSGSNEEDIIVHGDTLQQLNNYQITSELADMGLDQSQLDELASFGTGSCDQDGGEQNKPIASQPVPVLLKKVPDSQGKDNSQTSVQPPTGKVTTLLNLSSIRELQKMWCSSHKPIKNSNNVNTSLQPKSNDVLPQDNNQTAATVPIHVPPVASSCSLSAEPSNSIMITDTDDSLQSSLTEPVITSPKKTPGRPRKRGLGEQHWSLLPQENMAVARSGQSIETLRLVDLTGTIKRPVAKPYAPTHTVLSLPKSVLYKTDSSDKSAISSSPQIEIVNITDENSKTPTKGAVGRCNKPGPKSKTLGRNIDIVNKTNVNSPTYKGPTEKRRKPGPKSKTLGPNSSSRPASVVKKPVGRPRIYGANDPMLTTKPKLWSPGAANSNSSSPTTVNKKPVGRPRKYGQIMSSPSKLPKPSSQSPGLLASQNLGTKKFSPRTMISPKKPIGRPRKYGANFQSAFQCPSPGKTVTVTGSLSSPSALSPRVQALSPMTSSSPGVTPKKTPGRPRKYGPKLHSPFSPAPGQVHSTPCSPRAAQVAATSGSSVPPSPVNNNAGTTPPVKKPVGRPRKYGPFMSSPWKRKLATPPFTASSLSPKKSVVISASSPRGKVGRPKKYGVTVVSPSKIILSTKQPAGKGSPLKGPSVLPKKSPGRPKKALSSVSHQQPNMEASSIPNPSMNDPTLRRCLANKVTQFKLKHCTKPCMVYLHRVEDIHRSFGKLKIDMSAIEEIQNSDRDAKEEEIVEDGYDDLELIDDLEDGLSDDNDKDYDPLEDGMVDPSLVANGGHHRRHRKKRKIANYFEIDIKSEDVDTGMAFPSKIKISERGKKIGRPKRPLTEADITPCSDCNFVAKSRMLLVHHRAKCHPCFECDFCGKGRYRTMDGLLMHISKKHTGMKYFRCHVEGCDFMCKDKEGVKRHQSKHATEKSYICAQCGWQTKWKRNLRIHRILKHTTEKKFKCKICPTSFKRASDLKYHMYRHNDVKPIQCQECGFRVKTNWELRSHMLSHSDIRPFKCDYSGCTQACKTHADLVKHQVRHKKERDFVCEICQKGYKSRHSLNKHIKIMHIPSLRQVECNDCGKILANKISLNKHMEIHRNKYSHKCTVCGHRFRNTGNLRSHMRVHETKDRPFQCPICPVSSKAFDNLLTHIGSFHGKDYAFFCEICHKPFKRYMGLRLHYDRMHTEEERARLRESNNDNVDLALMKVEMQLRADDEEHERRKQKKERGKRDYLVVKQEPMGENYGPETLVPPTGELNMHAIEGQGSDAGLTSTAIGPVQDVRVNEQTGEIELVKARAQGGKVVEVMGASTVATDDTVDFRLESAGSDGHGSEGGNNEENGEISNATCEVRDVNKVRGGGNIEDSSGEVSTDVNGDNDVNEASVTVNDLGENESRPDALDSCASTVECLIENSSEVTELGIADVRTLANSIMGSSGLEQTSFEEMNEGSNSGIDNSCLDLDFSSKCEASNEKFDQKIGCIESDGRKIAVLGIYGDIRISLASRGFNFNYDKSGKKTKAWFMDYNLMKPKDAEKQKFYLRRQGVLPPLKKGKPRSGKKLQTYLKEIEKTNKRQKREEAIQRKKQSKVWRKESKVGKLPKSSLLLGLKNPERGSRFKGQYVDEPCSEEAIVGNEAKDEQQEVNEDNPDSIDMAGPAAAKECESETVKLLDQDLEITEDEKDHVNTSEGISTTAQGTKSSGDLSANNVANLPPKKKRGRQKGFKMNPLSKLAKGIKHAQKLNKFKPVTDTSKQKKSKCLSKDVLKAKTVSKISKPKKKQAKVKILKPNQNKPSASGSSGSKNVDIHTERNSFEALVGIVQEAEQEVVKPSLLDKIEHIEKVKCKVKVEKGEPKYKYVPKKYAKKRKGDQDSTSDQSAKRGKTDDSQTLSQGGNTQLQIGSQSDQTALPKQGAKLSKLAKEHKTIKLMKDKTKLMKGGNMFSKKKFQGKIIKLTQEVKTKIQSKISTQASDIQTLHQTKEDDTAKVSKVGRPKKIVSDESTPKQSKVGRPKKIVSDDCTPKQSKVGRPKKIVSDDSTPKQSKVGRPKKIVSDESTPKQSKVGRPKKIVSDESIPKQSKVGRPKKIVSDESTPKQSKVGRPKKTMAEGNHVKPKNKADDDQGAQPKPKVGRPRKNFDVSKVKNTTISSHVNQPVLLPGDTGKKKNMYVEIENSQFVVVYPPTTNNNVEGTQREVASTGQGPEHGDLETRGLNVVEQKTGINLSQIQPEGDSAESAIDFVLKIEENLAPEESPQVESFESLNCSPDVDSDGVETTRQAVVTRVHPEASRDMAGTGREENVLDCKGVHIMAKVNSGESVSSGDDSGVCLALDTGDQVTVKEEPSWV